MASIAVMIATPTGTRLIAASCERDAAVMVEAMLLRLPPGALPTPLWVQCADEAVARRLTAYLIELQADLARTELI